ncbi:thermolysin metallopeptidase [Aspergillus uvarum CBS 121591]|uniref:Thermolysin metallopeptidase n=1 Tax=Aspergillus uvarum CBS 121591 TaxID=1448315 RepID=A0A319CRI4_9EURO|nr:thermolysin metallopeptidase [Aspergillus uvarum CBS 121591]PYH87059.1 thermolysin metallopeptidase [Aspergillus uvarum CBS 121591]
MAPLCGIIPEYVLKTIVERGSAPQNVITRCQTTIGRTQQIQSIREAHRESVAPLRRQQAPQAVERGGRLNRTVYDAQNSRADPPLRNVVLLREGDELLALEKDPTNNANECYVGLGKAYDFFFRFFEQDSIDNRGFKLDGFVHSGELLNAFFDGRAFVFGDGDGVIFNGFTDELDVIGHEFSHGVVEYTNQLPYSFQSGALNEHLADVFGIMVKQWGEGPPKTVDQSDWLIGEGIWAAGVNGRALRDMKNPGLAYKDPRVGDDRQPAHWRDYKNLKFSEDYGGVHINSGIPNRAFYLAATLIGGYAWEGAGRIWYNALRSREIPSDGTATFKGFADLTMKHAENHVDDVREAWVLVGYPFSASSGGRNELR